MRERLDALYPGAPQTAGILRAMLLGDRSFVEQAESVDFQKTGVFHVLVVAGLHVGALAFFLYWPGNRLRLPRTLATVLLLVALFAYITVVEQRAPVLRAGLMTAIVVLASFLYRRLEIFNSAAVAAIVLLVAKPGPQIAIISAGEQNPYGHPSPELLERLQESGVRILRTDRQGVVQVVTDGHRIRVGCFVTCEQVEQEKANAEARR